MFKIEEPVLSPALKQSANYVNKKKKNKKHNM